MQDHLRGFGSCFSLTWLLSAVDPSPWTLRQTGREASRKNLAVQLRIFGRWTGRPSRRMLGAGHKTQGTGHRETLSRTVLPALLSSTLDWAVVQVRDRPVLPRYASLAVGHGPIPARAVSRWALASPVEAVPSWQPAAAPPISSESADDASFPARNSYQWRQSRESATLSFCSFCENCELPAFLLTLLFLVSALVQHGAWTAPRRARRPPGGAGSRCRLWCLDPPHRSLPSDPAALQVTHLSLKSSQHGTQRNTTSRNRPRVCTPPEIEYSSRDRCQS